MDSAPVTAAIRFRAQARAGAAERLKTSVIRVTGLIAHAAPLATSVGGGTTFFGRGVGIRILETLLALRTTDIGVGAGPFVWLTIATPGAFPFATDIITGAANIAALLVLRATFAVVGAFAVATDLPVRTADTIAGS